MHLAQVKSTQGEPVGNGHRPAVRRPRPSWLPVLVFLILTVGLSWLVQVGQALIAGRAAATASGPAMILYAVPRMAPPAIAAYVARRWWEDGQFADAGLRWPGWRYGTLAWLLPIVLSFLALVIALPFYRFDGTAFVAQEGQLALSLTVAVPIIAVIAFGEEFGWRSYLLPRLMTLLGPWPGLLAQGAIWGAWHAPLILLLGYAYPGHRLLGMPLFIVFATLLGAIIGWLQLASQSVVASCIAHGAADASLGLPLVLLRGADPALVGVLYSPLGWVVLLLAIGVLWRTGALACVK
jgi:membrane protease YdiL (CAAX protease family)